MKIPFKYRRIDVDSLNTNRLSIVDEEATQKAMDELFSAMVTHGTARFYIDNGGVRVLSDE